AEEGYGAGDQYIIDRLQNVESPVFLVINKIDQVHPEQLFPMINFYKDKYSFAEIVPISALQGNNVNTLLEQVIDYLEEGPQYYPSDHVTDHPERFIVAELVREKVLHLTREEIPHSVTVVTEQMVKREGSDVIDIHVTVVVERSSQKGIIIGKQGKMLKEVGKRARQDIEALLGSRVFMEIWVKVVKDWRNKPSSLRDYGYREDDY
ncbi:MAG: GTPase Era, partial [Anaerobacillus sp.]